MKLPFRQGIVKYETDISSNQLFLQENAGTINLNVVATPTMITLAYDTKNYLYTEKQSVISAWPGPFIGGNDYWLYWNINMVTGARTFGMTEIKPIVSHIAPTAPPNDQHWFDLTQNKMKFWNGTLWIEVLRVFACKYENASNIVKMSISPGSDFSGSQASLTTVTRHGHLIFDKNGNPLKAGKLFFTTDDDFVAAIPTSSSMRLETLNTEGLAQTNISAYSIVYFSAFNEIMPANPSLLNNVVFGIIEEDAGNGQIVQVVNNGVINNPTWNWTSPNKPLFIDGSGTITETPSVPPNPVATVLDKNTIILRPSKLLISLDTILSQNVEYDNTTSGLVATDVKAAIDEITTRIVALETP